MDIRKKALGIGGSAVLIASLLASIAAPAALAGSSTVIGGGAINPGGPASTVVTIASSEADPNEWPSVLSPGTIVNTVTLTDKNGVSVGLSWSGTPTVSASGGPAPFSCSAGTAGAVLTITCSGSTNTRLDSFSVTGLKIKAAVGAAIGDVVGMWAGDMNMGSIGGTATATLVDCSGVSGILCAAGAHTWTFSPSGALVNTSGSAPGKISFNGADAVTATGATATTFSATSTADHNLGATLTQPIAVNKLNTVLATVGDTTSVSAPCTNDGLGGKLLGVKQGVNNQGYACDIRLDVGRAGFVPVGATVTFAITTAGAKFSHLPLADNPSQFSVGTGTLSLDRMSVTYTVATASTSNNNEELVLENIDLDIAQSAVAGAKINVNVTVSGKTTIGNPVAIAQVQGTIVGVGSVPTVLIGYNDQATGLITITENVAGALSDELGGTANIIRICNWDGDEWMVRAPWAVVTKGDMKLNSGGLPVTQVKMVLDPSGQCASALVWQQSTVASTIEIHRGVDAASSAPLLVGTDLGPAVSVDSTATPGPVSFQVILDTGVAADLDDGQDVSPFRLGPPVINAMRAYAGSPILKALSQPIISAGGLSQLGGSVTLEETFAGQFSGDEFHLCILPRSSTQRADVFFSSSISNNELHTSNQPVVTTNNETGLVASFESFERDYTNANNQNLNDFACIEVEIDSDPVVGLGKITVSNIHYDVTPDAPNGAVQLFAYWEDEGSGVPGTDFGQTISNATVGAKASASISRGSALGLTHIGAFTTWTKVQATGKYITWRFVGGAAIAGKLVQIQVATRGSSSWSTFTTLTSRIADSSGRVFFHWRSSSPKWISVRAFFPGDAAVNPSYSSAAQGRWR